VTGVLSAGIFVTSAAASPLATSRATETPIDEPGFLVLDQRGHLFVTDFDAKVRKIDLRRKTITTVAGNGKQCCYQDGKKANKVSLDFISAIAVDSESNLFISDFEVVREVDARTGLITTIAGNGKTGHTEDGSLAVHASFTLIDGLAISPDGDLFIADRGQEKIFKVDRKSGKAFRIAGSGQEGFEGDGRPALGASFDAIGSIVFDHGGNLAIVDSEYCLIRRVELKSGVIDSIAVTGGPMQGCPLCAHCIGPTPHPGELVVNSAGEIYFTEPAMQIIARVEASSKVPTIVFPFPRKPGFSGDGGLATEAEIDGMWGFAMDAEGNLSGGTSLCYGENGGGKAPHPLGTMAAGGIAAAI
jgi:sugar lactone lactonase YvrE